MRLYYQTDVTAGVMSLELTGVMASLARQVSQLWLYLWSKQVS